MQVVGAVEVLGPAPTSCTLDPYVLESNDILAKKDQSISVLQAEAESLRLQMSRLLRFECSARYYGSLARAIAQHHVHKDPADGVALLHLCDSLRGCLDSFAASAASEHFHNAALRQAEPLGIYLGLCSKHPVPPPEPADEPRYAALFRAAAASPFLRLSQALEDRCLRFFRQLLQAQRTIQRREEDLRLLPSAHPAASHAEMLPASTDCIQRNTFYAFFFAFNIINESLSVAALAAVFAAAARLSAQADGSSLDYSDAPQLLSHLGLVLFPDLPLEDRIEHCCRVVDARVEEELLSDGLFMHTFYSCTHPEVFNRLAEYQSLFTHSFMRRIAYKVHLEDSLLRTHSLHCALQSDHIEHFCERHGIVPLLLSAAAVRRVSEYILSYTKSDTTFNYCFGCLVFLAINLVESETAGGRNPALVAAALQLMAVQVQATGGFADNARPQPRPHRAGP